MVCDSEPSAEVCFGSGHVDLEIIVCGTFTVEGLNVKFDRSPLSTVAKFELLENLVLKLFTVRKVEPIPKNCSFSKKIDSAFGALAHVESSLVQMSLSYWCGREGKQTRNHNQTCLKHRAGD